MSQVIILHSGNILLGKETIFETHKRTLHKTLYDLNVFFFDYFWANKMNIRQLPPLDDWTRSDQDPSMWYIHFPDNEWMVSVKTEILE